MHLCACTTYRPFVQESVVELHKLLLSLFCVEVLEELGVKVAQLAWGTEKGEKSVTSWAAFELKEPLVQFKTH